MRLRTTAPPSAFLMLNPNRLTASLLARRKTVKWELDRRFPARYTASNSPRRTNRASRGNSRRPALLGREAMASLFAARCQNFAAAGRLHARAESVGLRAAASPRLICALWQSNPPLLMRLACEPVHLRLPGAHQQPNATTRHASSFLVYASRLRRVKKTQPLCQSLGAHCRCQFPRQRARLAH